MNPNLYGIIEMALTFGLAIGFGIWQLVSLERDKKKQLKDKVDESSAKPDR